LKSEKDKLLVIIPARGGSKGIPKKNIKLLNGKPLITYTLEVAVKLFDKSIIYVSTDDLEIKKTAEQFGISIPELRAKELAQDISSTQDVLLDVLMKKNEEGYFPDTIVLLQPTSPFRTYNHLKESLEIFENKKNEIEMLVSVKETKSNPYYVLKEEDSNGFLVNSKNSNITRRQDLPNVYELNGAIYIIKVETLKTKKLTDFKKVIKYVMDEQSSHDIDTLFDWLMAEMIINSLNN